VSDSKNNIVEELISNENHVDVKFPRIQLDKRWIFTNSEIDELLTSNDNRAFLEKKYVVSKVKYVVFFISTAVIVRVMYLYIKQFFVPMFSYKPAIASVLLNVGRGYDSDNIIRNFKINASDSIEINAFNLVDFMKHDRVTAHAMIKHSLEAVYCLYSVLRLNLPNRVRQILIRSSFSNMSVYIYLRSFFSEFNSKYPGCIVYSDGAILASHASINSGVRTIRAYHGVMQRVYLGIYPAYDSIYVYSQDEQKYLINLDSRPQVFVYQAKPIKNRDKSIIIFMDPSLNYLINRKWLDPYDFPNLVQLLTLFGYKIYIKNHPLMDAPEALVKQYNINQDNWFNRSEWSSIMDQDNVSIVKDRDASSIIYKIKPSFVAGWGSTALCEALNMGVVPINMLDINKYNLVRVYQMHKRTLLWPRDAKVIKKLLLEDTSYDGTINSLRKLN
jgi:hypothetical protein